MFLAAANDCSLREELRRRFVKAETTLFRIRYLDASELERREFCKSRDFDWTQASIATCEWNLLRLTCI
jgi:DNA primase large subunit